MNEPTKTLPRLLALGALGVLAAGCAETLVTPVTLVPTRTPGVTYVIVRPTFPAGTRFEGETNPTSEYILVCDGRPADGMHCELPTEAALERVSQHPRPGKADKGLDGGIGTLTDLSVKHTNERDTERAPTTTPTAAPPPPPPPPPPPTAAPVVEPTKTDKKDDKKGGAR